MKREPPNASRQGANQRVIPIAEERLHIGREGLEGEGVTIDKRTREREVVVDEPLISDEADVRRVVVNEFVDEPPEVREEDDELIIPLLEEVLVKKLLLREEVRIARRRTETRNPRTFKLREVQAEITREEPRAG